MTNEIPTDWIPVASAWVNYFYKQQLQFVTSEAWQRWFISANGTGKSLVIYWNPIAYMLGVHPKQFAEPPLTVRILVPSFDNVREVALVKLLEPQKVVHNGKVIDELGPLLPKSAIKTGFSKDHPGIDLKNGSRMIWVTEVQGWKLERGTEHDILIMDEESGERVWDENKRGLRNAKNGGKILGALTPPYEEGKGPTWTKDKIIDAELEDLDIEVFKACMADNPAISEEFIKRFSKGKTPEQIRVQIFGEYPTWGKIIHYPWQDRYWNKDKIDGHIVPMDIPVPDYWEVEWVMAFDWHPSKPCAAVWGWIDSDGDIVFYDELDPVLAENKEIPELAEMFLQIEGAPHMKRKFRRWQDPSAKFKYKAIDKGFNAWDEFKKNGILCTEGKNRDPDVGIGLVNDYLKGNCKNHPRMFVRENCKHLRHSMGNHYWKRTGDDMRGKPDPRWSDLPICVRYILQEVGMKYRPREQRKKWPLTSYEDTKPKRTVIDLGKYI